MYLLSQIWLHLLMACVAGAGFGAGLRWFCARRSQARAMEQAKAEADADRQREILALQTSHAQELSSLQERLSASEVQSAQDLAQRDADLADLREQHGARSQEAAGHLERAQALSAELTPLRLQANQAAGELVQLQGRHDALEQQLSVARAELAQSRQAHALAEQEGAVRFQALQSRLDEAGTLVAAGQAEQASTLQELQSANGRVDVLLQEAAQAALVRQALSDQVSAVNEQLAAKGETVRQQQVELERLTAELTASQAEGAQTRDAAAVAAAAALAAQQALRREVDQTHVHAQERQALLGRERDTLHAKLSNAQQQLLTRQEALDAATQCQEALQAELAAESSRSAEVLESHARAEQGWTERLQALQAGAEESQATLQSTQATLERTQAELLRMTTELEASRREAASAVDRSASQELTLQAQQERAERLSAELEKQRVEAGDAAAAAAAAALVAQQALRNELDRVKSGAQEQLAAWAQERETFNGKLQAAQLALQQADQAADAQRRGREGAEQARAELEAQLAGLRGQLDAQATESRMQTERMLALAARLSAQQDEARREREAAQVDLAQQVSAVRQAQAERDALLQAREGLQQQVHTLALRVDETLRSGQEAQANALAEQRAAHEVAWAQSEASLVERDQRLAEQAVELSTQLRRQTALASELDSLRRQLAQQAEAQLQFKVGAERDLEAATQRERGLSSELAALRMSLESNGEQLALQAARLQQEQARQSGLESALADCRDARSRLNEEANRLRHQADELQAENRQLRQAEARAQAELAEAQAARPVVSPLAALSAEALEPLVLAAGAGLPPPGQAQPVGAALDDLKIIVGIGPVNEAWLHQQGIWTFAQIASWNVAEVAWIAHHLPNFGSRVFRENWVAQAARLAAGEPVETATRH